jgi:ribosomal protein S6--L-glutamate ligase
MPVRIGIITIRGASYHPNCRLLQAARAAGHQGMLIHPYRLWPGMAKGQLGLTSEHASPLPHIVLPRQGAQIGDACLALIHHFQLMGIPLINDLNAVFIARNKFLTQQVLAAAGLPCPDTVFVNDKSGFDHAVDRLGGYPVVVKPVSERQGEGVLRVTDQTDARQRALPALDRHRGLMVQRYLPPENRRDIRALIIGGECSCAATLFPPEGDFRANFHLGSDIRPATLSDELEQTAVAAAKAVGCDVAGVDMMVNAENRPFIVEVNYSPGFKGMESANGMDIAGRIIQLAADRYREKHKRMDI